jgi:predicted RNA-binding Zn-ribbon protein involved in translation (DUF1610 family)
MKICGSCDQSIQDDEQYTKYDIPSPSTAGATVYRHDAQCKRVEIQTTQASVRH